jgi:hypothetical protein
MTKNNRVKSGLWKKHLLSGIPGQYAHWGSLVLLGTTVGALSLARPHVAEALNIYSDNGVQINLDTTVEYANFYRVNDPSAILTNNINGDEGDRNFRHGLVSNYFSALPVLDIKDGNYGAHVSGQFYLDTEYLQKNQNNSPATFNPISTTDNRSFTSATRNINGQNAMLLDAFVYGSKYFGAGDNQEITVKVGRQTLLWGQSLFFSANGIAAGQAPIDILTAEQLPNAETQQIILPVGQAVVTYQPNQVLTFQAYYQFEWEHDVFQGVGSYFSSSDLLDKGGQRLIAVPGAAYLYRVKDLSPEHQNGQFGASAQATLGNYDVGLYALRYDAKAPEVYTGAPQADKGGGTSNVGSYYLVYPRDIQIYGAAVSTTLGPANVAAEISGRRNMPLDSNGSGSATYPGSANAGALYPVGSTMAAQISALYLSPGLSWDPGGLSLAGEYAMNHVLSVDRNRSALAPGRDNTAGEFEFTVTPTYFFSFLPNIQINFPVGFTYDLFGRSQIDSTENHGTGAVTAGVTAIYLTTWTAGLVYKDYIGKPDPSLNSLADRGYLSFNVEHTF